MMKRPFDVTTIEGRRRILLNRIRSNRTNIKFAQEAGLTSSFVSSVMCGGKLISTSAAKRMEARLGLIPGVLQDPSEAYMSGPLSAESLFLDPQCSFILDEAGADEMMEKKVNDLRVTGLKAVMGRLSLVEFCTYYGFSRKLVQGVLAGTRPFPLTLAKKLESRLKLTPGSLVYPDDSIGDEVIHDDFHRIHTTSLMTSQISSSGERLLDSLAKSIKKNALSEGQILALATMLKQFVKSNGS